MLLTLASFGQTKENHPNDSVYVCTCENTFVFTEYSEVICKLSSGILVKVIGSDLSGRHYKVKTSKNIIGYISKSCLRLYSEVLKEEKAKAIAIAKKKEEIAKRKKIEEEILLSKLTEKYGSDIAQKIISHIIWIGMTEEMTKDSLGEPLHINRTVYSSGTHEQWVYPDDKYLYFENGILTSWQDSR